MELLLLIVLIIGFSATILFMRSFIKQLSDKVAFFASDESSAEVPTQAQNSLPFPPLATNTSKPLFDKPSPNQVGEDESAIELSEQNLSALPKDVKFEVEGGDMHLPPGFEEGQN